MIKVNRGPKPAILKSKAAQWLRDLKAATTDPERKQARNKYRHPQVRQALETMFHGKCAYCEASIHQVTTGHIEHFRPQSRFPRYTFSWNNLLLACHRCNNDHKKAAFPKPSDGGPLIDPCRDEPLIHFEFRFEPSTGLASVYGTTDRGIITEKLLQLNRVNLRRHRSAHVKKLYVLAAHAVRDPRAAQLLTEARQNDAEYAAFARAL